MNRKITLSSLLFIIINGTIGSAWLFAPYYAAKIAGPFALISWLLGGLMTLLIAFTFAETSAKIPMMGATTHVAKFTHGELTAFIMSWVAWLSSITIPAIEVQAVLQYASNYLPFLMTRAGDNASVLSAAGIGVAISLMFFLIYINIRTMKMVMRSHIIILLFKIAVIFIAIVSIGFTAFHAEHFHAMTHSRIEAWKAILTALSTGGVAFAFVGFKHGVELSGETVNPKKSVPAAIIGSVFICLCLYVGLEIVFIGSLSPLSLIHGWHHLSFSGDLGPFAGIAAGLGLFWLVKLLMMDAIVSPLGAGSVYVSSTARLTYAMSQQGYFPALLSRLNKNNMPLYAAVFNALAGCLLFLPLPNWQSMVQFLTSILVISYAMGPVALLSLRKTISSNDVYFKLPCARVLAPLAFYCCNLISYWTGWETVSKTMIVLCVGMVILLFAKRNDQYAITRSLKSAYWLMPYFIGLTAISYFGSFGGKKCIPFGWDFLVIAVFSFLVFQFAARCSCAAQKEITYCEKGESYV